MGKEALMPRRMPEDEMGPGHPELWRRLPTDLEPVGAGYRSQSMNTMPCDGKEHTCPCYAHVGDRTREWFFAPTV